MLQIPRWKSASFLLVLAIAVTVFFAFFRGIFVSEDVAMDAAKIQGMRNIKVTHHAWIAVGWRGCSDGDAARFTVEATNPAGERVEFYVCSGLMKGGTIRTK